MQINVDEVQTHVDSRYVSPPEAAWRLFRFKMHDQAHSVKRLAVHLPVEQSVTFDPNQIEEAIQKAERRVSTLMAWFKLNEYNPDARQYKYYEIPEHFVLNNKNQWIERQRGPDKIIGRMYSVSMREPERHFLRLRLLHVNGAKRLNDLLTHNEQVYTTFFEAANARGLTLNESVWDDTLLDAANSSMCRPLRELFACICVFGSFTDATGLWIRHRENLIEDFARIHVTP